MEIVILCFKGGSGMSLNETHSAERIHISFGRRNCKSSIVNAFTGQDISVVSDVKVQPLILYINLWNFLPWSCYDN